MASWQKRWSFVLGVCMYAFSQLAISRSTLVSTAVALALGIGLGMGCYALLKQKESPKPVAATVAIDRLAVVNGKTIPLSAGDALLKFHKDRGQPDTPELRAMVRKQTIDQEILVQEAEKQRLTQSTEFKDQLEFSRRSLISQALLQDFIKKNPPDDTEIKAEYDRQKAQVGVKEYHVRHILLSSEDEAKDVIAKLNGGAKFDKLAKLSKDEATAPKGGDIGWISSSSLVNPVSTALLKLQQGQFTDTPVKTDQGYHVIRLEGSRSTDFLPFDQVKSKIAETLIQRKVGVYTEELRMKAQVQ
jgi:peptidyl-prolyl cis-trans isomerase C